MTHKQYMRKAISLSIESVKKGGGPFGAIIVKDQIIIGTGTNQVTASADPTAHAEILAIREAARHLNTHDLSGCTIYSSCEPCPMCLGAIYWARLSNMYFGNSKRTAASIGFDDHFFYKELALANDKRSLPAVQILEEEAKAAFKLWDESSEKITY